MGKAVIFFTSVQYPGGLYFGEKGMQIIFFSKGNFKPISTANCYSTCSRRQVFTGIITAALGV